VEQPTDRLLFTIDGTIAAWNPNVGVVQEAAPSTHAIAVATTTMAQAIPA
jgi:hypothetical protein